MLIENLEILEMWMKKYKIKKSQEKKFTWWNYLFKFLFFEKLIIIYLNDYFYSLVFKTHKLPK